MIPVVRPPLAALAVGALLGCSLPHRPAVAHVSPWPPLAFEIVVDTVRVQYPELDLTDAAAFKIQSVWVPHARGEATGLRRATVWREGDQLNVVVETRYLSLSLAGLPHWSPVRSDRELEAELLSAVQAALGLSRVAGRQ